MTTSRFTGAAMSAGILVCALAVVMIAKRQATETTLSPAKSARKVESERTGVIAPEAAPESVEDVHRGERRASAEGTSKATATTNGTTGAASQTPSGAGAKEPIQDPLARAALSFVGADPQAEAYWYGAINDPTLPPHERQDLIEDLNEDGFPDPEHPTLEDVPLILSRLQLIEAIAPEAMDQVNADAMAEAYKDLFNMYDSVVSAR